MTVAQGACAEGDTMGNMPFEVTPQMVVDALKAPTLWVAPPSPKGAALTASRPRPLTRLPLAISSAHAV